MPAWRRMDIIQISNALQVDRQTARIHRNPLVAAQILFDRHPDDFF